MTVDRHTREPELESEKPNSSNLRTPFILKYVESYALLALTVGLALFFTLWPQTADTFPTLSNIKILLASQAIIGLVAIGALLPLIVLEFDLSVGANAALTAVLVTMMLSGGTPIPIAIAIGIVTGVAVGVVNLVITTWIGVSGIVTTLGTSTIIVGVLTQITGGLAPTSKIPAAFTNVGNEAVFGIPIIFIILIAIAAVVYFCLEHTPFGRRLYAAGSNPKAAELVGINLARTKAAAFLICSVMASIGGILYVARAGGADPRINSVFLLPALAAAFLSAAAIKPGRYNVWGTIVAIYFLAVLNNGLSLAGAPAYVSDYSNGLALILGVAVATVIRRRSKPS